MHNEATTAGHLSPGHLWCRNRVKARDKGGKDGILLSTSEGLVTNSTWRCIETNPGAELPAVHGHSPIGR